MSSEAISSYSLDQILIMLLDKRGVVPSKLDSDWMKEGNLVISADDSNSDGSISFDRSKFIDDSTFERWMGSSTLQNGDIIITSEGGSFARVSRIRVDSVKKIALGQRLFALRTKPELCDQSFLYHWLRSHEGQYAIKSRGTGLIEGIRQTELKKILIKIPTNGVDQKIGHNLDMFDELLHVLRKWEETSKAIISSLFRSWFIDFDPVKSKSEGKLPYGMDEETAALFPDSFEDSEFGLIPTGWKLQTLSDIAQIVDCSHATKPEPIDTGYGVLLHVWNIDDSGGITLHETFEVEENEFNSWASRMVLSEGDCVVTKTGRVAAVGRIPHNLDRNLAMGRNMIGIRMENAPGFLYAYLMSPLKEIEVIKWLNSGTVMPSLHVKYAERLNVIVPSEDILAKFEEIVKPLIRLIDDSRAKNVLLSTCRDLLLPRLMSGELEI